MDTKNPLSPDYRRVAPPEIPSERAGLPTDAKSFMAKYWVWMGVFGAVLGPVFGYYRDPTDYKILWHWLTTVRVSASPSGTVCDNSGIVATVIKIGNRDSYLEHLAVGRGVESATPDYSEAKRNNENEIAALRAQIGALRNVCYNRTPIYIQKMVANTPPSSSLKGYIRGSWTNYCDTLNNAGNIAELGKLGGNYDSPEDYAFWRENYEPIRFKILNLEQKNKELDSANSERIKRDTEVFKLSLKYRLDLIRLQERDATTGSIVCRAKLVVDSSAGSFSRPLAYVAEKTTDGRHFIEVFWE